MNGFEALVKALGLDEAVELTAATYDILVPGLGGMLRELWAAVRPEPPAFQCDCPLDPHHRWNCHLTPLWAQTMRDLDTNPWTVVTNILDCSVVSRNSLAVLAIHDHATDTEFRHAYEAEKPRWTDLADRLIHDHVGGDW